jgi:methylmalonyl-CoA mutase C-terminal domain/subunit
VERPYRIVVAKPGLDGHDRGAKTITRALRDHGFEVIYTGLHQTPEQIAETVLQEDADGVGLSLLSGAHLTLFPRVIAELAARELDDVMIFGGGVIPDGDVAILKEQGVSEIFGPGSSLRAIGEWLEAALDERESA